MNAIQAGETKFCQRCSEEISPSAPEGICPSCALLSVIETAPGEIGMRGEIPLPQLTNYEILEEIGQGGMGIVYKARQKNPERIVALKVILTGTLAGEKEVKRFRAEAQAVAKLRHENIVTIFEVGQENGHHFFSMEYVEGDSLLEKLRGNGLTPAETARLIKKVAEAVDSAHEQGILHRDLKPANILIDKKGEPRITDFGLAQQKEVKSDLTRSGTILGTPGYMPPEQAMGRTREINVCSDVYSLGATLYETLTGRPPFQAESILETLTQVVELAPAAPRLLNPNVPADLEVICLKCLRKQPLQRYASARALAEDLGRFLNREPIEARPIGIIERNVAWCLRNPLPASALATAALLVVLLAVAAFLFRADLLKSNVATAGLSARVISTYLEKMSVPVVALAGDPEFQRMVQERQTNELREFMQEEFAGWIQHPEYRGVFTNVILMAANGDSIIRVPGESRLLNRVMRDYYRGATNTFEIEGPGRVHFSEVYKSVDDAFTKIGMSCAVSGKSNSLAGVVAFMMQTFSPERRLGLGDERQKTVVLARWDQSATNALGQRPKWVVWLHPKYERGTDAIPIEEELGFEGRDRSWLYFDPAARVYPDYRGPWLAGYAEVPKTPFLVVVQSRDWVGLSFGVALAGVITGAGAIEIYRRKRIHRKKRLEAI